MITYIILSAFIIIFASLLGVFLVHTFFQDSIGKHMPYLVSFSAGVFVFTSGFMTLEALHISDNIALVGSLVLLGFASAWVLKYILPGFHHHHNDDHCDKHTSGLRVLLGDGLHNIADGLVLVPAFMISPYLGVATATSFLIHELLQETSEFFVLKSLGYSTKKALLYNLLVSLTIFIGIGIGLLLTNTLLLQAALLAFAAGFFVTIIFQDLLPHTHGHKPNKKTYAIHVGLIVLGLSLMGIINAQVSHSHEHEADHADHAD